MSQRKQQLRIMAELVKAAARLVAGSSDGQHSRVRPQPW